MATLAKMRARFQLLSEPSDGDDGGQAYVGDARIEQALATASTVCEKVTCKVIPQRQRTLTWTADRLPLTSTPIDVVSVDSFTVDGTAVDVDDLWVNGCFQLPWSDIEAGQVLELTVTEGDDPSDADLEWAVMMHAYWLARPDPYATNVGVEGTGFTLSRAGGRLHKPTPIEEVNAIYRAYGNNRPLGVG